ncbi:ATP-binding protein [bacterium]|nr:ATP-binding protein [bacterium]
MREISLHILDVARNSIEAGAQTLTVCVTENRAHDEMEILIEDDGSGMDAERLSQATDAFFTTRTTRRWGLGLPLFQATCERSGGKLEVTSAPGRGTRVRASLQLSHLDRPPLGDMGAVIQALTLEPALQRVKYRQQTDGQVFELDTGDLIEELGAGSLSDPAVLTWLREYVNEGVEATGAVQ